MFHMSSIMSDSRLGKQVSATHTRSLLASERPDAKCGRHYCSNCLAKTHLIIISTSLRPNGYWNNRYDWRRKRRDPPRCQLWTWRIFNIALHAGLIDILMVISKDILGLTWVLLGCILSSHTQEVNRIQNLFLSPFTLPMLHFSWLGFTKISAYSFECTFGMLYFKTVWACENIPQWIFILGLLHSMHEHLHTNEIWYPWLWNGW